jgi:dodecin
VVPQCCNAIFHFRQVRYEKRREEPWRQGSRQTVYFFFFLAMLQPCRTLSAAKAKGGCMVEKIIDLTGSSSTSIEDAVSLAVARAAVTISGIYHVEVCDISAVVEDGLVSRWKVKIKATFPVKDRVHE